MCGGDGGRTANGSASLISLPSSPRLVEDVVVEEEARERRRQRFGTAARATSGSQSDMWWRRLGRRILRPSNEGREGKGKRRKGRRAEGHAIVSFVERVRQNEFGSDRQVDSANRRPGGRGYLYSIPSVS